MPVVEIDLEDGKLPVSFTIKQADLDRFQTFMKESLDAIQAEKRRLDEIARLKSRFPAIVSMLEGYADSYDTMARTAQDKPARVLCRSVAVDIRQNMASFVRKEIMEPNNGG